MRPIFYLPPFFLAFPSNFGSSHDARSECLPGLPCTSNLVSAQQCCVSYKHICYFNDNSVSALNSFLGLPKRLSVQPAVSTVEHNHSFMLLRRLLLRNICLNPVRDFGPSPTSYMLVKQYEEVFPPVPTEILLNITPLWRGKTLQYCFSSLKPTVLAALSRSVSSNILRMPQEQCLWCPFFLVPEKLVIFNKNVSISSLFSLRLPPFLD